MMRLANWITLVLGSVLIVFYVAGYTLTEDWRLDGAVSLANLYFVFHAADQLRRGA